MTQPTSVDMTFDTSLVDVNPPAADINASFSTIESDQTNHVQLPKPSQPIHHVATQDAYNQWASVYDSDGNMLQAIDDIELATLLPDFLTQVMTTTNNNNNNNNHSSTPAHLAQDLHILDLGCGTGRNTLKLLSHPFPPSTRIFIHGLDFSQPMLDIAQTKLSALPRVAEKSWSLHCCDVFSSTPTSSSSCRLADITPAHAIVSTLVLEHVALSTFFTSLAALLRPRGMALVTNMHPDMGHRGSQAGFVNPHGVKVRGSSFVHSVDGMVKAAEDVGLQVLELREREVTEGDVEGEAAAVGRRGRKWVGVKVWVGMVVRRRG